MKGTHFEIYYVSIGCVRRLVNQPRNGHSPEKSTENNFQCKGAWLLIADQMEGFSDSGLAMIENGTVTKVA